jgi:hypothetical protein
MDLIILYHSAIDVAFSMFPPVTTSRYFFAAVITSIWSLALSVLLLFRSTPIACLRSASAAAVSVSAVNAGESADSDQVD